MEQPIINILTRTTPNSNDWRPVFATLESVNAEYAAQYVDINRQLGWTKYRFVY